MHTPADPRPPRWPHGRRSAVALAFDLDGPTGGAMLDGSLWDRPGYFALGGYGPHRALPRLLDLLDDGGVPATFFTPAWVVEHWPQACRQIVERGHEVAHHGYRHECYYDLTADEQADVITRSQRVFRDVLGTEATGFRSPSGDWHPETRASCATTGSAIRARCAATTAPTGTPSTASPPTWWRSRRAGTSTTMPSSPTTATPTTPVARTGSPVTR
ncbi:polysaccharide deacetylase family protein [Streptomyces aureus]